MRELYPEIESYSNNTFSADNHNIYYELSGNPEGIPVIFLHGGPGSGCNENHRRYFNPEKYKIIIFDQRGCNRSTPRGCIEDNTSNKLLDDMEYIRRKLKIEKWLIFGGSWGATLGLLYAETYPAHVSAMILRGTFLARQQDLEWFIKDGVNNIFPDYWQEFISVIPSSEHNDLIAAYHKRIFGAQQGLKEQCALAWSQWATRVVTYTLEAQVEEADVDIEKVINEVSIETHYAINSYFIKENQILNDIDKLPDVPVDIIHGRRDLTCTLNSSWYLHNKLPKSNFIIVPDAGHLAGEPAMINALISSTDKMYEILA